MTEAARKERANFRMRAYNKIWWIKKERNETTKISAYLLADHLNIHHKTAQRLIEDLEKLNKIEILEITGTYNKRYTVKVLDK